MKRASLAEAKAHLSALVSEAQHRKQRVIILRHGKPSAAIVPVEVALGMGPGNRGRVRRALTAKQVRELLRGFGRGRKRPSAVRDLLAGRR